MPLCASLICFGGFVRFRTSNFNSGRGFRGGAWPWEIKSRTGWFMYSRLFWLYAARFEFPSMGGGDELVTSGVLVAVDVMVHHLKLMSGCLLSEFVSGRSNTELANHKPLYTLPYVRTPPSFSNTTHSSPRHGTTKMLQKTSSIRVNTLYTVESILAHYAQCNPPPQHG